MNVLNWATPELGGSVFTGRIAIALLLVFSRAGLLVAADQTRPTHNKPSTIEVPPRIAAEATRRGIPLGNIKLQGNHWVGCTSESVDAACIVLGQASATTAPVTSVPETPTKLTGLSKDTLLDIHQYGHAVRVISLAESSAFGTVTPVANSSSMNFQLHSGVEARVSIHDRPGVVIDTLPRYRKEGTNLVRTKDLQLVRDTIDARPDEPFTVIVTVPALCEPCRRLDKLIHDNIAVGDKSAGVVSEQNLQMKVFMLEYFSFADAEREFLGAGAVFPTTLIYGVESQPRKSLSRLIGNLRGSSLEEISRPLAERFRRGSPHTLSRGIVSPELLFRPASQRISLGMWNR